MRIPPSRLLFAISLAAAPLAGTTTALSPGARERFEPVASACPTFSWTLELAAAGYRLRVVRLGEASEPGPSSEGSGGHRPALDQELPAGASSWTPPASRCFEPGAYAWAVGTAGDGGSTSSAWSDPMLFLVPEPSPAGDPSPANTAAEATRPVDRRTRLRAPTAPPAPAAPADDARNRPGREGAEGGGQTVAILGETSGKSGPEYGVAGRSASSDGAGVRAEHAGGGGADLELAGDPPARLTESALTRTSGGATSFDFANPGVGAMRLTVDGVEVVTTATDQNTTYAAGNQLQLTGTTFHVVEGTASGLDADRLDGLSSEQFLAAGADSWVDESGDSMSGALSIDVPSGFALQTGAGDSIALGGNLFKGGQLLLHDTGTQNTALGNRALGAVTSGSNNSAAGYQALSSNTTGIQNTAMGSLALWSNSVGTRNTAAGHAALQNNSTGSNNTAAGNAALFFNNGSDNTAVGTSALHDNTGGGFNSALGSLALAANTTGSANTAAGYLALRQNTTGTNNTGIGSQTLQSNTVGARNTAVGSVALFANTEGVDNTAVGVSALQNNSAASFNTAVGAEALSNNQSGAMNTASGAGALSVNSSGSENTAHGAAAMAANQTGSFNTALGTRVLAENLIGNENTGVGWEALHGTTGPRNTAVGASALRNNSTGNYNVALGWSALVINSIGQFNTAVGGSALFDNSDGNENTAVGNQALVANRGGDFNTAVGVNALFNNSTGNANTAVGERALFNTTTGQRNVAVGSFAGSNASTGSDNIFVGSQGVAGDTATVRIGTPGTQSRTFLAGVRGVTTGTANAIPVLVDGNGQLGTVSSSRRFKQDVRDLDLGGRLLELRPVSFRYREPFEDGARPIQYGLVAEEVAEVLPELVVSDEEGRAETVKYHLLPVLLLDELRRLRSRVAELERVAAGGDGAR